MNSIINRANNNLRENTITRSEHPLNEAHNEERAEPITAELPTHQEIYNWVKEEDLDKGEKLTRHIIYILTAGLVSYPADQHKDQDASHLTTYRRHLHLRETREDQAGPNLPDSAHRTYAPKATNSLYILPAALRRKAPEEKPNTPARRAEPVILRRLHQAEHQEASRIARESSGSAAIRGAAFEVPYSEENLPRLWTVMQEALKHAERDIAADGLQPGSSSESFRETEDTSRLWQFSDAIFLCSYKDTKLWHQSSGSSIEGVLGDFRARYSIISLEQEPAASSHSNNPAYGNNRTDPTP
ncbi:hypothetical protein FSARC_23 [Fusarium sarcochroum]|uniref:Uncharacterized protein n=1 Tax=Fusarium sarcochroum TaxID=1208366 RepID=A0A8H4UCC1_9HYPO|nr:hypothetical protein FSARC_23 [Fusarium sarcochroum]